MTSDIRHPSSDLSDAYHPFRSAKAKQLYLARYDMRASGWPVHSESRLTGTSFGHTFVRISGPDDAPPLVLLPGANATSLMWFFNIKALSTAYKTYAVDSIYDYGRSVPVRPLTKLPDLMDWLDELFSALDLGEDINLMGMSYGGWLAGRYALHRPNRLRKAVLLAPACTVLPLGREFMARALLAALPLRFFARNFFYWILEDFANRKDLNRQFLEQAIDDALLARRCFRPIRFVTPTVMKDEELQGLKAPTLFLVGEDEKIYSTPKAVQRLNKVAPHIETEIIPNAGHALNVVQASLVHEKVLEFLRRED